MPATQPIYPSFTLVMSELPDMASLRLPAYRNYTRRFHPYPRPHRPPTVAEDPLMMTADYRYMDGPAWEEPQGGCLVSTSVYISALGLRDGVTNRTRERAEATWPSTAARRTSRIWRRLCTLAFVDGVAGCQSWWWCAVVSPLPASSLTLVFISLQDLALVVKKAVCQPVLVITKRLSSGKVNFTTD
ncbi:hypothetical protein C8Q79DRAFT_237817 [Trametes meyenii]|nr:hypothetical protein C8Q79DRAFT_237817 [Trametes meyenii]